MVKRIHLFGASGTGVTTLGKSIANATGFTHIDTDDVYWIRTDPPFSTIRERRARQELLRQALEKMDSWVLSGSLCGWGDFAVPMFDLVVFLWVPPGIRMQRLKQREIDRYGPEIENPCDPGYEKYMSFLEWAAAYDTAGLDTRSKVMHEKWLSELKTPSLRIEGTQSVRENTRIVMQKAALSQRDTNGD